MVIPNQEWTLTSSLNAFLQNDTQPFLWGTAAPNPRRTTPRTPASERLSSETFQFFTSWPPSTLHSALSFSISSSSAGEDPCCHAVSVPPEPASDAEGTYCGKRETHCEASLKRFDWSRAHRPLKLTGEMRKNVGTGSVAFTVQYGHSCWVSVGVETIL